MSENKTPPGGRWGASESEWQHFAQILGSAREDLLPVVSNLNARISPLSKMKDVGKTPSLYNGEGHAVGIPQWTGKLTADRDILRWQGNPDLGICLQTRLVRALDIDVTDPSLALDIVTAINDELDLAGVDLPMRYRGNSSKCLMAFQMPGEWCKRILRVQDGAVEFLATGQQFIAIGTHPSGVRYEWTGGLPGEFPLLPASVFEGIWARLEREFSVAPSMQERPGKKPTELRAPPTTADPLAGFLEVNGWVRSIMRDGRLNITCPFEAEHSSDTAESATQYFPAGTGGFQQGHFRCLHAHCAGRDDSEYIAAVGYLEDDFEVLPALAADPGVEERVPGFRRNKAGEIEATVDNVCKAVASPLFTDYEVGFDSFRDEIMLTPRGEVAWRPFADADYTRLRIVLETRDFKAVGRELIRDAVTYVADQHRFDSAITWIETLKWDGVPRIDTFLPTYLGTQDSPYTRAVGTYLWTALAGRVLEPGCKAEMVPVLIGTQGSLKTSTVQAMAPAPEHFTEIVLDIHDNDLARKMRGKLVGEIGELRGLHSRDGEAIKQWFSRQYEEWTPKYREFAVKFPRRLVMVATTNEEEFLADPTGERRWLPVRVGRCQPDWVARDRLQLWAEGRERWKSAGVCFADAERLARDVHGEHKIGDSWENAVKAWLDDGDEFAGLENGSRWKAEWHLGDVFQGALGVDAKSVKRADEMRLGRVMHTLGFEKVMRWDGKAVRKWVLAPLAT